MHHNERFLQAVNDAKSKVEECTAADVVRMREDSVEFHFVDVREGDEWRAGRAAGAIHLGKGVIERDIERVIPDVGAKIVLYCGGGYRSALAALSLKQMGYRDVISMDGGMRAWREAKLPLQHDAGEPES